MDYEGRRRTKLRPIYLECINNDDLKTYLTLGKVYKCYVVGDRILCTDDRGDTDTFYLDRFESSWERW